MTTRWTLLAILLAASALASPFHVTDLGTPGHVDYLVVAADAFVDDCDLLLAHRQQQGLRVGVVGFTEACLAAAKQVGVAPLMAFLQHARQNWQTKFVVLVGDAVGQTGCFIPMQLEAGRYYTSQFLSSKDLATDYDYGTAGGKSLVLHVGRLPADTREELAAMIAKTIAYETASVPGPWQHKIALVTSKLGFSPLVDSLIEGLFAKIVGEEVPAPYHVELAYGQPQSPYCPYPPHFHANAVRLMNEGCLFYVYAGHGTRTGCDDITWRGQTYPIMERENVCEVAISNGMPVMVILACSTGWLDWAAHDCVAEDLMKLRGGPVAVLAASRISQPYGNALLGRALIATVFGGGCRTLGEAIDAAKEAVLAPDDSPFRKQVDGLAAMVQGADSLAPMRSDVVRHYNLLGDPALKLQLPDQSVALETEVRHGRLLIRGTTTLDSGTALVSLECARTQFTKPVRALPPETDPRFTEENALRYREANDKAYARQEVPVSAHRFELELPLPEPTPAGPLWVKVVAWGEQGTAVGASEIRMENA